MESLRRDDGAREWESPIGDGVHYEGTSTAAGVAYMLDGNGFLDAFDAQTGEPLLHRQMELDTGGPMVQLTSSGVAIAEHTVFVADTGTGNEGYVIAYGAGG